MLTVAKYDRYDMVNNPGENKPSFTIWFSGCHFRCNGCHNEKLWDGSAGKPTYVMDVVLVTLAQCRRIGLDTVILLGGEPLDQDELDIYTLCTELRNHNKKVWLYTGYDFNQIPKGILNSCDVVKCGRYIDELKCDGFPSSSNQQLWKRNRDKWERV
jgi:anaerobic ribonucleoside-triphosphate reductase activating protein